MKDVIEELLVFYSELPAGPIRERFVAVIAEVGDHIATQNRRIKQFEQAEILYQSIDESVANLRRDTASPCDENLQLPFAEQPARNVTLPKVTQLVVGD